MRDKLFRRLLQNHPEGAMLTGFQLFVKSVLFPIQWICHNNAFYDPIHDVWNIHGKKFTGKALYDLANSNGVFKISQVNGSTTLVRLRSVHIDDVEIRSHAHMMDAEGAQDG